LTTERMDSITSWVFPPSQFPWFFFRFMCLHNDC
jgi:hypothetical protein